MSVSVALDMLPADVRTELARFIRDHDVPLHLRELTSAAFALGYGIGGEEASMRSADAMRSVADRLERVRVRLEAMES